MPKRPPREIPFKEIELTFALGSYFFGEQFCPAVSEKDGGYRIRVVASTRTVGADTTTNYDYFQLSADGTVNVAPRGYAKDFKPGRVIGLEAAVAKYSAPDSTTARMALPW